MSSSPEDFKDLKRLLALKKHEQPPPGYFYYLPDTITRKIERTEARDLAEHSTWWEWLVQRFDARPVLAGAYAFAISGLLMMGFKVSRLVDADGDSTLAGGLLGTTLDPASVTPSPFLQTHFANPAGLVSFSSASESVFNSDPLPLPYPAASFNTQRALFTSTAP
ncbi:MAG: hypothetical protein ACO1QB_17650 [Verrucomicrobiales bacterium]